MKRDGRKVTLFCLGEKGRKSREDRVTTWNILKLPETCIRMLH